MVDSCSLSLVSAPEQRFFLVFIGDSNVAEGKVKP